MTTYYKIYPSTLDEWISDIKTKKRLFRRKIGRDFTVDFWIRGLDRSQLLIRVTKVEPSCDGIGVSHPRSTTLYEGRDEEEAIRIFNEHPPTSIVYSLPEGFFR